MSVVGHKSPRRLRALLDQAGVTAPVAGPPDTLISGLTDHSADVQPGDCFVAIRGTRFDGHRCIGDAVTAGASAVITQHTIDPIAGVAAVRVDDTRSVLARLAAGFCGIHAIQKTGGLRLVGVTGTNGKSTVCALITAMLRRAGRVTASFGTLVNDTIRRRVSARMTTPSPLSLCAGLAEAVDAGATDAVIEVSSHALDQRRCDGLVFSAASFTNLSRDHLDYHFDLDAYADAKARLFDGLGPGAAAVVNADDDHAGRMAMSTSARVVRVSRRAGADLVARVLRLSAAQTRIAIQYGDGAVLSITSPMVGMHNVYNVLVAVGTALALGVRIEHITAAVASFRGVPGRLQRVGPDDLPFRVFVDYAHTPDALASVLSALREVTNRRIICVFGCGGDRDRDKRPMMGRAVTRAADVAVLTSDNPRSEEPTAIMQQVAAGMIHGRRCAVVKEADRRRAIGIAIRMAGPGDTVLIAGKGHETYQQVGEQQLPFDDVAVASDALCAHAGGQP